MGAVTFSLDVRLVECLKEALPLSVLVETGTFKGDTVAAMSTYFDRLITVEFSEPLWAEAAKRFTSIKHIEVYLGKSPEILANLLPSLSNASKLFWLDAHWCVAKNTAGDKSQCPLLEEIHAIHHLNDTSVILIDDARLFLAPPPEPHAITHWPSFDQIITSLTALSAQHELMVINDVIAFYPKKIRGLITFHARKHGVDWLRASQSLNENTELRIALEEKETVIQQCVQSLKEKEGIIQTQHAALNVIELAQAKKSLIEKEAFIQLQRKSLDAFELQQAQKSLLEKEAVIQMQREALDKYHSIDFLFRPIKYCFAMQRQVKQRIRNITAPRLGNLNQYAARKMTLPSDCKQHIEPNQFPKISIVTPSFKQADYIGRTIGSVLDQKYPNLEYFVQDGGSQDGTAEILTNYGDQLTGWESKPDKGQSQAINLGFVKSSGELMAWLNSDDLLLPGALTVVVDYFNRHPEIDVVYGNRLLIDQNDMEIGRWIMPGHDGDVLSWVDYVPQETMFWRRRIWDKVGGQIDESFSFAMDWDLLVRFRDAGAKFAHVPHFLGAFRIHEQQKTSAAISEVGFQEMDRIRQRLLGRIPSRIEIRKAACLFMLKHIAVDLFYRIKTRLRVK